MNDVNREIAEKVMDAYGDILRFTLKFSGEAIWMVHDGSKNHYIENYQVFDPMHRIEHAWMVVEKFRKLEIYRRFEQYNCIINEKIESRWQDTAQEAICLAALKAKEGER